MDGPGNFAIDGRGHIWVTNNYVYSADPLHPACGSDLLLEFTPDGRYAPGSPYAGGGLSGAGFGISFDPDGNIWVSNFGFASPGCDKQPAHDSVSKFAPDGRPLSPDATQTSGGGFTEGSISWPQGTVSDREGSIWIANCGNDSVTLYPHGDPSSARNLSGLGLEKPFDIAINQHGQAFVTAVGNDRVAMLNPDGSPTSLSPISGGGLNKPMGIAVDSRGNMWVSNSGLLDVPCPDATQSFATRGGSLTLIGSDGVPMSATAFTGGGLTIPWGIAIDGNDNVWVANFAKKRLSQFCGLRPATCPPGKHTGDPISPNGTGYGFDGLVRSTGLAVDPSGNVWVTNNWKTISVQTNPGGYQIVAFIGLAAPLKTPLIGPPSRP
jgi:sugar lactone lactonase YvrE